MEKWDGELAPPPFWLRPDMEVTKEQDAPKLPRGQFVVLVIGTLCDLGCNLEQALGVAANTMNETGWGRTYRAWNLGGWKITKATSHAADGLPRKWWRALGNKGSGDPQTCFYRAFPSAEAFLREWLINFVPKAGTGRYKQTGEAFWSKGDWFSELIEAGYKGEVTRKKPEGSIQEHNQIIKTLIVMWAQHLLQVGVDGDWGPKSKKAASQFQETADLPVTGKLDTDTMKALFGSVPFSSTLNRA